MKNAQMLYGVMLIVTAHGASGQTATKLIDTTDTIVGVGRAEQFDRLVLNDAGDWLLVVDTDNPDTARDVVLLRTGFVTLREGDMVGDPPGATIDEFSSLTMDENGNSAWELSLIDPGSPEGTNQGLYWNTCLLALKGELLSTPGYSPTATWFLFNGFVKLNNSNQILVGSEVNDAAIGGFSDQSLILLSFDDAQHILSSIDVAHEMGNLPLLSYTIPGGGLPLNKRAFHSLNDDGSVFWQAKVDDGSGTIRPILFLNEQVLAQEGDASPIDELVWDDLLNVRLDINDRGDYVHEGEVNSNLSNRRELIAKNGDTVIVRERDALPDVAPLLVDDFGNGAPILLSNAGDVFYRADLTGDDGTNAAFFVNRELLIHKGVTRIDGVRVLELLDSEHELAISPGGRWFAFHAMLEDGRTGVFRMDLGRVEPLDDCGGNAGRLTRLRGFAVVGGELTLGMDDGQGLGVTTLVLLSYDTIPGYPPCGLFTGFGEMVIDFGDTNPFLGFVGTPWGGPPVPFPIDIANNLQLVDAVVYAQGFFVDLGGLLSNVPKITSTNAVEIEIGAP